MTSDSRSENVELVSINDINDKKGQVAETIIPHERQIVDAIIVIWKEDPSTESLGIGKLHGILKKKYSNWSVSEKRVKTVLKQFGLAPSTNAEQFSYAKDITSKETPHIELPESVSLVMTSKRGKGLFAKTNIKKGDFLWEETPLFLVPPLAHCSLIENGKACACCGKLVNDVSRQKSGLATLRGLDCNLCMRIWCSTSCKKRNLLLHSTLKHGGRASNKLVDVHAFEELTNYCIKEQWNALFAVSVIYTEIILDKSGQMRDQFLAMARVSQKIRYRALNSSAGAFDSMQGGALFVEEQQEELWKEGFLKFKAVFPQSHDVDYDEFLLMIGCYNINNLDSNVFLTQSHLNHNCDPNCNVETSIKRSDGLNVFAARDIRSGEELTTSYVNPTHNVQQRQRELRVNWGFVCKCSKCKDDFAQQQRRKSSSSSGQKERASIRTMLEETTKQMGNVELEIPLDFNGERRKSVRFDETVVKVT